MAAARIEVSGVRSSCVNESIRAVRSRSPSRAASIRAEASIAVARASPTATWALTAVATSCEISAGLMPSAPTGRSPSINVLTVKPPGITSVGFWPSVIARRLAWMLTGRSSVEV